MVWALSGVLLVSWLVWIFGILNIIPIENGAYAMLFAYIAGAIGLLSVPVNQPLLRHIIRWLGVGLALAIISQIIWAVFYPEGATGNQVLVPNIPMYVASLIFVWASTRIYTEARKLFGISVAWVAVAAVGALAITAYLFLFGPKMLPETAGNIISHNVLAIFATFTSLMMIGVAWSTIGGAWSRWIIPIAIGFTLYFVGTLLSALDTHYTVGETSDWCWMLAASALACVGVYNHYLANKERRQLTL